MGLFAIIASVLLVGTISQKATDVRGRMRQGKPGAWAERSSTDEYFTGLNQNPQAKQVTTVTLTDQGDDDDVIITINGVDVTYNTGTGKSLATFGAEFAAAINAEPLVRGQVVATFDTATLTLTAVTPGEVFTVSIASDPDSVLSSVTAVTAAAEAEVIPFGRLLISQGLQTGESERIVALAKSSLLTAQVITVTPTFVDAAVIKVIAWEIRGGERHFSHSAFFASATNLDTTIDGLVAALNTAAPAATVLYAANAGTATAFTATAEVAGAEWQLEVTHESGGASVPTLAVANTTGPSASTSIHRALVGLSMYSHTDPPPAGSNVGEYAGNSMVQVANRGKLWVESDQTVVAGSPVYVELGVAADNGQLFNTSSATRVALAYDAVRWERDGLASGDSVAVARLAL